MKKAFVLAFLLIYGVVGLGQTQFYIGVKGGIAGCFYQFGGVPTPIGYTGTTYSGKITSTAASIPGLLELIYSTKKFRVGYQFEYERVLTSSYTVKSSILYSSTGDTTIPDINIKQHFFCHNLILEYLVFDNKKNFRLLPSFKFGYFHGASESTSAPYDFSSLNANRFKLGVSLNAEYYFGPMAVVIEPTYSVAPIKSLLDATQKGYMHFLGLHIGMRFGVIKQPEDIKDGKGKKKKEYKNPEEDE
jgi:hypothetical protein